MNNGSVTPERTTRWKCFGCGRDGNAVDFYAEFYNVTKQQARSDLRQIYAPGFIAPRFGSIGKEFEARYKQIKQGTVTTVPTLDPEVAKRFDVDWGYYAEEHRDSPDVAYMLDRGFTPATLDDWGIGFDKSSERITIPVCDEKGNLVGFRGRAWKPNARPKYLVLGDKWERKRYGFPTYDKNLVVFGLHRWADSETQSLVLVEGEIDAISLDVMGIPAISLCGSSMSEAQAKLIRQYCDEIVLFFDTDKAGKNAVYGIDKQDGEHRPGIVEMLEPFIRVKVVGRHRFDANDYLVRGEVDRCRDLVAGATSSYAL